MDATDDEIAEQWEERSAIMEYDGGLSRRFAEVKAAMVIRKQYGRVPAVVVERMKETD